MKILIADSPCAWLCSSARGMCCVAALLGVLAMVPAPAFADVKVSGKLDAVSIEAENSSIEEIFSALDSKFKVQLRSSADLSKQTSGTYQGPIEQVLTRLLDGYNFIINTRQGQIEVTVVGTNGAKAVPGRLASEEIPNPQLTPKATTTQSGVATKANPTSPNPASAPRAGTPAPPSFTAGGASSALPVPALQQSSGAVPTPGVGSGSVPEVRPSSVAAPMPRTTGAGLVPMPSAAGQR